MPQSMLTSKPKLTEYGQGLAVMRQKARHVLEQWIALLDEGHGFARMKEHDKTNWEAARAELRDKRGQIYRLFESKHPRRIERFQVFSGGELGQWDEVNGKIRIYHHFRFGLPREPGQPSAYFVDAVAVHEAAKDVNPAEVQAGSRPLSWNLIQIGFTNVTPAPEKKGFGPGG
jgi:hypothetical protein